MIDHHDTSIQTGEMYRRFGTNEAHDKSPLYETIALAVADDADLLALLAQLPVQKRQPNLFLGAVRYLFGTAGSFDEFRDLVLTHWDDINEVMRTKRTQTNEVGRCATLLPILATLPEPLHLLEIGASAGLCLLPDRYGYDFGGPVLQDESPVRLACELRGFDAPLRIPTIGWRLGIDLEPLEPSNPDDRRWLEALVWPGMDDRATRLRAALQLAQHNPPEVRQGDLRDGIGKMIEEAPSSGTTVVFHSAVLPYVQPEDRVRFVAEVADLGVTWIAYEGVGIPGMPSPPGGREFVIALNGSPVARADGHGQWVESW